MSSLLPRIHPGPSTRPNPIQGGRLTSGLPSLRLSKGSDSGGNKVGADVCMGVGSGLVGRIGLGVGDVSTGEGGDSGKGIWGGDEDHGDSGDAGGEDIASNLATSDQTMLVPVMALEIVILAVMRYAG
ncbi:hypothetical protein Tco_1508634 [Tanacetum coccineum]